MWINTFGEWTFSYIQAGTGTSSLLSLVVWESIKQLSPDMPKGSTAFRSKSRGLSTSPPPHTHKVWMQPLCWGDKTCLHKQTRGEAFSKWQELEKCHGLWALQRFGGETDGGLLRAAWLQGEVWVSSLRKWEGVRLGPGKGRAPGGAEGEPGQERDVPSRLSPFIQPGPPVRQQISTCDS